MIITLIVGEGGKPYPIVDAGMRELDTGYMHNRLRMITGSFLVKIYFKIGIMVNIGFGTVCVTQIMQVTQQVGNGFTELTQHRILEYLIQ